jgi:hypothetical protein
MVPNAPPDQDLGVKICASIKKGQLISSLKQSSYLIIGLFFQRARRTIGNI